MGLQVFSAFLLMCVNFPSFFFFPLWRLSSAQAAFLWVSLPFSSFSLFLFLASDRRFGELFFPTGRRMGSPHALCPPPSFGGETCFSSPYGGSSARAPFLVFNWKRSPFLFFRIPGPSFLPPRRQKDPFGVIVDFFCTFPSPITKSSLFHSGGAS